MMRCIGAFASAEHAGSARAERELCRAKAPLSARVMFVGEAPGAAERLKQLPHANP